MMEGSNPIREMQINQEEKLEIGRDILKNARNELYLSMGFLDVALSALDPVPHPGITTFGTDGKSLFFQPDWILKAFLQNRVQINRLYLHQLLHCLFCHVWHGKNRKEELWSLASDIAVESVIDELYQRPVYKRPGSFRREVYRYLKEKKKILTAEAIYRILEEQELESAWYEKSCQEFRLDDHSAWLWDNRKGGTSNLENQWKDMREKMQIRMETISKESSRDAKSLLETIQVENRERYDYREFLRKFSVWKEEMTVDVDSFDYVFYHYGMELYGNMPLIEPLESKEMQKIQDFVIVVDTSMSCKGELVRHFLEETYGILSESESFFRHINVHIIQCDDRIQEDQVIHDNREMESYLRNFTVKGLGGTDFRPAFAYVEKLRRAGAFQKLRGLIYFTDGYGLFPVKMPPYDTAFVFMREDYRDVDVPPWAIKLVIDTETLETEEKRQHEY